MEQRLRWAGARARLGWSGAGLELVGDPAVARRSGQSAAGGARALSGAQQCPGLGCVAGYPCLEPSSLAHSGSGSRSRSRAAAALSSALPTGGCTAPSA